MRNTWLFRWHAQVPRRSPLTPGPAPQRRVRLDQASQELAGRSSSLNLYRPVLEVLEDRTLLSFITAPTYAVGSNPQSVAVGDFNGDGIPDVAVASLGNGGDKSTLSILLGKGDGTFQAAQNYVI